jgi:hypothetical protein
LTERPSSANVHPEAAARMVSGASLYAAQWIANADDPEATTRKAVKAFKTLLNGLLASGRTG